MTNKNLIDHCNSFWGEVGHCEDCKYCHSYCDSFRHKTGLITPYREDKLHPYVYTDEEIEDEN